MTRLSDQEEQSLRAALDDEYHAWATYDQVIRDFGPVRPFTNIRAAEARHIGALTALFRRYGLVAPENPWVEKTPRYNNIREACRAGVEAEIANAALYDRLIAAARHEDVRGVFQALRDASQLRHLPAFRRGAERPGRGRGSMVTQG